MAIYLNNVGGTIELISGDAPARIYYGGGGTSGDFKPADVSRAGELNGFLINLGGDSYSVKYDDLVINGYYPTTLELASEALQALFSQTPYTPPPLILQYDGAGNVPYTTLGDWNEFFGLGGDIVYRGLPFTSLVIDGENVYLRGGKDITLKDSLFFENIKIKSITDEAYCITSTETQAFGGCHNLIGVSLPLLKTAGEGCFVDCDSMPSFNQLPSLVNAGDGCFENCTSSVSFDLPLLQSAGDSCFQACTSATSFNLPSLQTAGISCFIGCSSSLSFNFPLLQSAAENCFVSCSVATSFNFPSLEIIGDSCFDNCLSATLFNLPSVTNLGLSVEDNAVFNKISNNVISLTIPSALMTCWDGDPDGDIQYLVENNTVTINQV